MKRIILLLTLLFSFASRSQTTAGHLENFLANAGAGFLGTAGNAYFNPSGLAFLEGEGSSLSVSSSTIRRASIEFSDPAFGTKPADFQFLPNSIFSISRLNENTVFAFDVVNLGFLESEFNGNIKQGTNNIDVRTLSQVNDFEAGACVAYKLSSEISAGLGIALNDNTQSIFRTYRGTSGGQPLAAYETIKAYYRSVDARLSTSLKTEYLDVGLKMDSQVHRIQSKYDSNIYTVVNGSGITSDKTVSKSLDTFRGSRARIGFHILPKEEKSYFLDYEVTSPDTGTDQDDKPLSGQKSESYALGFQLITSDITSWLGGVSFSSNADNKYYYLSAGYLKKLNNYEFAIGPYYGALETKQEPTVKLIVSGVVFSTVIAY